MYLKGDQSEEWFTKPSPEEWLKTFRRTDKIFSTMHLQHNLPPARGSLLAVSRFKVYFQVTSAQLASCGRSALCSLVSPAHLPALLETVFWSWASVPFHSFSTVSLLTWKRPCLGASLHGSGVKLVMQLKIKASRILMSLNLKFC